MLDVIGNSMEPLIRHKDTILVDQSVKEPSDGKIFLVGLGEELLVKRLQRTARALHSGPFYFVKRNYLTSKRLSCLNGG